ncbi:MAG TPA: LuxR C-terminal-related transcriptional regulator, partial [Acidimicrobiales bacterium]|nr:LuxR C-terminal-related transcriptional regulator [Acidimicrobiales bacterium]
ARDVCGEDGTEPVHVLELITSLVDKCLVQADAGTDRFRLHETMRAHAGDALAAIGATAVLRDRHLRYFTDLAKTMGPKANTGELPVTLAALEPDLDNMRAALDWAVTSRQFDLGAQLFEALGQFFLVLGLWPEGLARGEQLLAADLAPSHRAGVLHRAASMARNSDPSLTLRLGSELISLGRSRGDNWSVARGMWHVANVQAWSAPDEAVKLTEEHLQLGERGSSVFLALQNKAWAHFWLGLPREAFSLGEESGRVARDIDYLWGEVQTKNLTSLVATYCGRPVAALSDADVLVRMSNELSSPTFLCWGERHRGEALMYLGDGRAQAALARARAVAESIDDAFNLACVETCQGQLQVALGHDDDGYLLLESGISKLEALGFARMCVRDRAVMAEVALRRGNPEAARYHLKAAAWRLPKKPEPEGVPILRAEARLARAQGYAQLSHRLACDGLEAAAGAGQVLWATDLLELVAITASDLGRHPQAARLLGAAEAQRELSGYARFVPAREELGPVLLSVESTMGEGPFELAVSEGRRLSLEEAVAYARRGKGTHTRSVSGWESLTATERRVALLVAEHLTNAEIADQLFVSTVTVKSHLTHVFDKLGVTDRRQLAEQVTAHLAADRG